MVRSVVVGLHLRWAGVWQRPNHILSRLARHVPVVVVEEPVLGACDADCVRQPDGLTLVVPERRIVVDTVDDGTLATLRRLNVPQPAVVWLYSPAFARLRECFPEGPLVYDKMDELAAFKNADPRLIARERDVVGAADAVFAGGRSLWDSVRGRARAGGAFPSGVDVEHYARETAARGQRRGGPVFGYVGVIDERLDLSLIAALARARPDATVLLVGPVTKIDPATLPRAANIRYLGKRSYEELPELIAGFDVAIMPFAINDATRFISPTKTLEFLAAGRAVVSTPVADVVTDFGDVVWIAEGAAAFIAAVGDAQANSARHRDAGLRRARAMSWDAIVDGMLTELARRDLVFPQARALSA